MVAFPPCKINLGLRVLRRRPDGYHDIETCFYPIPRTDVLEVVPSKQFRFMQTGIDIPGSQSDNICVKAYELLKRDLDIGPVEIHLHKLIPAGSGLGAGSSDGAWTLRLLDTLFGLSLSSSKLSAYARQLGSDCSFFIQDKPMFGEGRGDHLSEANLSLNGKFVAIVCPDVHVSTHDAYQAIVPESKGVNIKSIVETLAPEKWKDVLRNQFEDHAFKRYPQIQNIREELYRTGALYAAMSGSGSAVFGLFNSEVSRSEKFASLDYWSGWLTA
jgi:4-diphosphocytidyl-2-C-methyl-D-erythritol kinase